MQNTTATNGIVNTVAAGTGTGNAVAAETGTGNTVAAGTGTNANASVAADGNQQLQAAFDTAIAQAQKTLEITTVRGAELYALKQRAQ